MFKFYADADQRLLSNNICAIIITYYPDSFFSKRVSYILPQVNQAVIIDNNSSKKSKQMLLELEKSNKKISLVLNQENLGVGAALNQGVTWARDKGYNWVLLFDQDTTVESFMVQSLVKTYESYHSKDKVALIASNFVDANSHKLKVSSTKGKGWVECKTFITSGTLLSLDVFFRIGPFREDFFIDGVDHEYCLRAWTRGYRNIVCIKPLMKHPVGTGAIKHIFGLSFFSVEVLNHKPFRYYFIVRNTLILLRDCFWKDPVWVLFKFFKLCGFLIVVLLYEQQRKEKLRKIFFGICDAVKNDTTKNVKMIPI